MPVLRGLTPALAVLFLTARLAPQWPWVAVGAAIASIIGTVVIEAKVHKHKKN